MTGSGIRTEAVSRGGGAVKRLKSGSETLLKLGQERPSKFGSARRLKLGKAKWKFGKAFAVAAPTTASAAKDTMTTGIRPDGPFGAASGFLLSCVALSGVSVT
jgi:hypothetical protein